MDLRAIFIALCLITLCSGKPTSNEQCRLPSLEQFDSNMLTGTWYQVLRPTVPLGKSVLCFVIKDVRETQKDSYARGLIIHPSSNGNIAFEDLPMHFWFRNNTSIHQMDKKYEYIFVDLEKNLGVSDEGVKEIDGFFSTEASQLSDYENYMIWMQCGPNGERFAAGFTRTNHPSPENILQIRNALIEAGGGWSQVQLHLTSCTKLDIPYPEA
uniref:uncharacterized protein LOC120348289 n=1 Tax=Styela clava TaxID=7725 RepID=UPI00193A22DF|nr:uncharacterized protein LOC120348289 [Styela clava]